MTPDYNFSGSIYKAMRSEITVVCDMGHEFSKISASLLDGHGCPECATGYNKSVKEEIWINSFNDKEIETNKFIYFNDKRYNVDGINKRLKIVYEFWGNFWHGNPRIYNQNDVNKKMGKTFGYLYNKTLNKISNIENAGYKLIQIWEDEFDKIFGNIYKSINNNT